MPHATTSDRGISPQEVIDCGEHNPRHAKHRQRRRSTTWRIRAGRARGTAQHDGGSHDSASGETGGSDATGRRIGRGAPPRHRRRPPRRSPRRTALLRLAVLAPVLFTGAAITGAGAEAVPAPGVLIEDTAVGSGVNQVSYFGDWSAVTGGPPATPNGSYRRSTQASSGAVLRFTGVQLDIYGLLGPDGGITTISVDGQTPTAVNTFASSASVARIYQSGLLNSGVHTAVLVNVGWHDPASGGIQVTFDRAQVYVDSGPPPGQRWLSGANGDPVQNAPNVDAFCSLRGRPCDLAHVFVSRNNWQNIVQPSWTQANFAGWPGRLVISVPPFPENSGHTLTACAAGAYDSQWRTFGHTLNSTGRQNSIIRIAWEANGNWYQWSGSNPAAYVGCWRHIADAINSTAEPDPLLDWTINAHYSQNPPSRNPLDLYPGNDWVDIIGIDAYDHYPPSRTLAEFNNQANAVGGITWLYNFARANNKLFGIGEWGVVSGRNENGAGDNPNFIRFMRDWMEARANAGLYYENYYNTCEPPNVGSNLYRPTDQHCLFVNNASAQLYTQLWSIP
ncbi:beta-mannanase [Frankia sp. Cpl3]|nr:beta-mannanase [Frankia sp. Cpl3]